MTNERTDKDLCILLASAERSSADSAFTELYSRYSKSVYGYCVGITGDKDKANDLFQETFLRFYNAATQQIVEKPHHYLIRIARNLHLSGQSKMQETPVDMEAFGNISQEIRGYEHEELYLLVLRALELLHERQREVFVLREFEGLSYQEIADVCNISLSNAKMTGIRAKQKITSILQPYIADLHKFDSK